MKLGRFIFIIIFSVIVLSCGGGSSSDDSDDNNSNDSTDTNNTDNPLPSISGFDISLREGDFWEYEWDYYTSTVYSGGGSSGTRTGVFRITLGTPVVIGDLTAFPLLVSGNNRQDVDGVIPFTYPRWTHIAISDNEISMSNDGMTFETVFNANTGFVIGFGFFEELSDQNLFEISVGSISNDYLSGDAYVLSDSASESNCEYFPSYGTICGADVSVDYTLYRREYYQETIGPVGYYYHYSASTGGTFDSVHVTNTINIGLVASSLRGDIVDYALETESNNTPATASIISNSTLPVSVKGDFNYQADIDVSLPENFATNHYLYLNARAENEPNNSLSGAESITLNTSVLGQINSNDSSEFRSFTLPGNLLVTTYVEDWYHYSMNDPRPFNANLEFYGAADGVDIDLWLFNSSGQIIHSSYANNAATDGSDDREGIRADLVAGDYYIGVDIWPNSSDSSVTSSSYAFSLTQASFGDDPAVYNNVAIADFYRLNVQITGGLTITTDSPMAVFLTELDGETVLASAPSGLDSSATQTVLQTPILTPGEYLIALGVLPTEAWGGSFDADNYEVTIEATPTAAQ